MPRTYSHIAEPRYVEKSNVSEAGGGSGSSSIPVIDTTLSSVGTNYIELSLTAGEIKAALESGKLVRVVNTEDDIGGWNFNQGVTYITSITSFRPDDGGSWDCEILGHLFYADALDMKPEYYID